MDVKSFIETGKLLGYDGDKLRDYVEKEKKAALEEAEKAKLREIDEKERAIARDERAKERDMVRFEMEMKIREQELEVERKRLDAGGTVVGASEKCAGVQKANQKAAKKQKNGRHLQ